MAHLSTIDLVGFWLGIFLTFCILSFLYKDNPLYKFAEHLFIGVSIGYIVTKQYYDTLSPKLVGRLADGQWTYLGGVLLSILLLVKLSKRWGWLGRFPIAFVVAFYAGLEINGVAQADLGAQIEYSMGSVVVDQVDINSAPASDLSLLPGLSPSVAKRVIERRSEQPFTDLDELMQLEGLSEMQRDDIRKARGDIAGLDAQATIGEPRAYAFGTVSKLLLLLGLLAGLVYFYFSVEQKGAVGRVSRVGVWVLMIGFGASFGYTVQGRISLAIGRALDIMGRDKDPRMAEQINGSAVAIVCIVIIVAGLVVWELRNKRLAATNGDAPADESEQ